MLIGSLALIAFVVAYDGGLPLLPPDARCPHGLVSDVGFVCLEIIALALCCAGLTTNQEDRGRWIWGCVVAWLALNLFADTVWGVYECSGPRGPSPGWPDLGYLASYAAAFGAVLMPPGRPAAA